MEKHYLNEKHRQYAEACQREVRKMMEHPFSVEEKEQQMQRNLEDSWARKDVAENKKEAIRNLRLRESNM